MVSRSCIAALALGGALSASCGARSGLEVTRSDAGPRDAGIDAAVTASFPCRWTAQDPIEVGRLSAPIDWVAGAVHESADEILVLGSSAETRTDLAARIAIGIDGRARLGDVRPYGDPTFRDVVPTLDGYGVAVAPCRLRLHDRELDLIAEIEADATRGCRVTSERAGSALVVAQSDAFAVVGRFMFSRETFEPFAMLEGGDLVAAGAMASLSSAGEELVAWRARDRGVMLARIEGGATRVESLRGLRAAPLPLLERDPTSDGTLLLAGTASAPALFRIVGSGDPQLVAELGDVDVIDPWLSTNETEALFALREGEVLALPLEGRSVPRTIPAPPGGASVATVVLRRGASYGGELFAIGDTLFWRNLVCNR